VTLRHGTGGRIERRSWQIERVVITMARPTGRAFLANFSSYDASFRTKASLALANSWRKFRTRSGCCGQYGQPGC
jgi:hypothetical protein